MAESDGQERSEEPTAKRQQEARDKGQIPRSRELNTVAAMLAGSSAFLLMGEQIMGRLTNILNFNLNVQREAVFDPAAMLLRLQASMLEAVSALTPLFILFAAVALLASVALGGWSMSFQSMSIKAERLDPIKGLGRVFSWKGLVEMFKGLAKFVLVATVAILYLQAHFEELLGLGAEPLFQGMAHMGELLGWGFLTISVALLLVVAIDVPFQLWDHNRQLKMTRQEIKEEHKQTEGSPEVRGKMRRMQMEMAQRRMMEEVPKADVVVTNPTHYAVALRYDQNKADAPRVVAKGADLIAMQIRSVAKKHDVPVLSAPPLARALYHSTKLNEMIPVGLYRAVAQVLAYVYHLRQGPIYSREGTVTLNDLPIPEELRRDD